MRKAGFRAAFLAALLGCAAFGAYGQALPPDVGKPLAQARSLLGARRFPQAMAQVNIASQHATTENERFIVQEMRASIAQASGDNVTAARVFADLLNSGRVPASEQIKLIQAEVSIAFAQKNYPAAIGWVIKYFKAGGTSPAMRDTLISAYYQNKDYALAAKMQGVQIAGEIRAHQKPPEGQLQLIARCQEELHDNAGFETTMVELVTYYPKPDYWANLVHNVQVSPGFSDRLTLDLDRLKMALGTITSSTDYMEMTELALQGPLPGEAKAVIDKGYAAGVLGTGAEAPRQERLRNLVNKTYASELPQLPKRVPDAQSNHDGNALVSLGEEFDSYGKYTTGIPLMEQGIAKDELRHPEDTKLHLALAYYASGNKPQAIKLLHTVGGKDGAAGIARLWVLYMSTH